MVTIRAATCADARLLARLRLEFRAALSASSEPAESFLARCTDWMSSRLSDGTRWRCWVAEREGAIVGQLWLQLVEKIPNPGPEPELHGYVTNAYVVADARGAGAGSALLAAAMACCRAARVDSVFLWPTERSRTLYARHGFVESGGVLEARLVHGREPA